MLDFNGNLLILTSDELLLYINQDLVYDEFLSLSAVDATIDNVINTAMESERILPSSNNISL